LSIRKGVNAVSLNALKILIRGAGEMASGVAVRLYGAGFRPVFTEVARPLCVRRTVSFADAVYEGDAAVEGVAVRRVAGPSEIPADRKAGRLALWVNGDIDAVSAIRPDIVIDAIIAKRNLGLHAGLADLVIALGPGFEAPRDAHVVIETNRGHNLGRLIYEGSPEPNTGVPGVIGGESAQRVLRAPTDGMFESDLGIGDSVEAGQVVGMVASQPVRANLSGSLRGQIRPGTPVWTGLKIGDVDPRGRKDYCFTISDKARAIGGAVLEAILGRYNR
jgi:xanthine dehydrogenase accessory factor